jgi:hypothetical protein
MKRLMFTVMAARSAGRSRSASDTPGSGESVTDTEYPDPLFYSLFTILIKARPGSWDFGFLGILYFLILYKGI